MRSALKAFASISDFDFGINEIHHTEKLDNPSGTALTLQKDLENAFKADRTAHSPGLKFEDHKTARLLEIFFNC